MPDFTAKTILLHLPNAPKATLGFIGRLPETKAGGDMIDLLALSYFSRQEGPLFSAIREDLRASYGFSAGSTNYDRATRILYIAGEVETEKLAEATSVLRETYERFRTDPDMSALSDIRAQIADSTSENVRYVDVAARTILELAVDGLDTSLAPRLGEELGSITEAQIKERLKAHFPSGDALIAIAVSPDANALPGACVIASVEEVTLCR